MEIVSPYPKLCRVQKDLHSFFNIILPLTIAVAAADTQPSTGVAVLLATEEINLPIGNDVNGAFFLMIYLQQSFSN